LLFLIYGAETIGLASAAKHEFLRSRGLDHAIDSRTADMVKEVHQITRGDGVEIVLDAQGGPSWRQSYSLLAPTGRLLTFGASNLVAGQRRSLPSWIRFC
jgi:synaptic vesicle membrane protein VAT-1